MDSILSRISVSHASDILISLYFAFGFFIARFLLDRFIFHGLSIRLLSIEVVSRKKKSDEGANRKKKSNGAVINKKKSNGAVQMNIDDVTQAKITKCCESLWKLTYYASVEACILTIGYYEPWFTNTGDYFKGWPNQELKFVLKLFYMCQGGFYIFSIGALLKWETRRKDFAVMMSHHVVTVILIVSSYIVGFFRIGSVILALHDASDVFMEAAKVFKYSGKELGASVCFGLFAVSWFILRLIIFPFWIIRGLSDGLCEVLSLSQSYDTFLYYFFHTFLLTLLVFHVYWWILIYSMIMRQLKNRGKVGEDIRSDSDDE